MIKYKVALGIATISVIGAVVVGVLQPGSRPDHKSPTNTTDEHGHAGDPQTDATIGWRPENSPASTMSDDGRAAQLAASLQPRIPIGFSLNQAHIVISEPDVEYAEVFFTDPSRGSFQAMSFEDDEAIPPFGDMPIEEDLPGGATRTVHSFHTDCVSRKPCYSDVYYIEVVRPDDRTLLLTFNRNNMSNQAPPSLTVMLDMSDSWLDAG